MFYALALLANASPADKTHARQKAGGRIAGAAGSRLPGSSGSAALLDPRVRQCGAGTQWTCGGEGLLADCALGAACAAHAIAYLYAAGVVGRLHRVEPCGARMRRNYRATPAKNCMRWITWCMPICRAGRDQEAGQVIEQLQSMPKLNMAEFKIAYAATAMPIRYAVERGQWAGAAAIVPPAGAPPQVVAIAVWARGFGLARSGQAAEARAEVERLGQIEEAASRVR